MKRYHLLVLPLSLFVFCRAAPAQPLVSPFAGSEVLGEYQADFQRLAVAQPKGDGMETVNLEGRLTSHLYRRPEAKSNLEVFRSYERELKQGGFKIITVVERRAAERLVRDLYNRANALPARPYKLDGKPIARNDKSRIALFAEYYLLASKSQAGKTYHVALILCRERGLYAVDVLESTAMETGTVSLSPELLNAGIEADGKVAIYDIHFDTGSAAIGPGSKPALEAIAAFLKEDASRSFYVVGHTDDTGTLAGNLDLSAKRAVAVVEALTGEYGIAADRLEARGVGPLAPVAVNRSDDGRRLNRRVEIVLRLSNR